jgi:heme/copper-type cytochrome/quinol oxidase subunit 2
MIRLIVIGLCLMIILWVAAEVIIMVIPFVVIALVSVLAWQGLKRLFLPKPLPDAKTVLIDQ